ncbi:MAG: lamin tail domain-containing protein [Kiritimatiellae bacterium]|nr:lamin tail domain-containing protein [Kiritimatiellia bacterium]
MEHRHGKRMIPRWAYGSLCVLFALPLHAATLVPRSATWQYAKGTSEASDPRSAWRQYDFDDSAWARGVAPIGYGEAWIQTALTDMENSYSTFFLRKAFSVTSLDAETRVRLEINYDDGVIVWINGDRVYEENAPDGQPLYNALATGDHESGAYETNALSFPADYLELGANVMAVQVFNRTLNSSDSVFDAQLSTYKRVADTKFSSDRGFYDSPFGVTITTATPGATIRYTTDCNWPSETSGTIGGTSVVVSITDTRSAVCLRALACKGGYESTDIDTHTYVFVKNVENQAESPPSGFPSYWGTEGSKTVRGDYGMEPTIVNDSRWNGQFQASLLSIPAISVTLSRSDAFTGSPSLFGSTRDAAEGLWKQGSAELIYPPGYTATKGGEGFQIDCGVGLFGGNAFKRSIKFKFSREFGPAKLNYPFFEEMGLHHTDSDAGRYDRLYLRGGKNRSLCGWMQQQQEKTTGARDLWMKETQMAMSGMGSHGAFAHVYVNGMYWGVYNPVERPDHHHASEYLDGEEEKWFCVRCRIEASGSGEQNLEYENGDRSRWDKLIGDLGARSTLDNAAQYQEMGQYLDLPRFSDYVMLYWYAGAGDWQEDNHYNNFYHVNYGGDTARGATPGIYFVWDAELAFSNLDDPSNPALSWLQWFCTSNAWVKPQFLTSTEGSPSAHDFQSEMHRHVARPFRSLWRNSDFRTLWADRMYKHCKQSGGALTDAEALGRFDDLHRHIAKAWLSETARWGDTKETVEWPWRKFTMADWHSATNILVNNMVGNADRFVNICRNQTMVSWKLYPSLDPPTFAREGGAIASGFALTMSNPNTSGVLYYTTDGSDPRASGGAPAAGAQSYTGPLGLAKTSHVRARVYKTTSTWSAEHAATFHYTGHYDRLRFTEIMYNPAEGSEHEFLEIQNTGTSARGLSDMRFRGLDYTFAPGAELASGKMAVLVADETAFAGRYPGRKDAIEAGGGLFGVFRGRLDNGGERLALLDGEGRTVTSVRYNDKDPWPEEADGDGYSLVPTDTTGDQDDPARWRASNLIGGSPGYEDGAAYRVVIGEALTHTDPPDVDAIELYNAGAAAVDIGGWYLSDSVANYRKYRIPSGTPLPAGGRAVFDEARHFGNAAQADDPFLLSSHGDQIYLTHWDAAGNLLYMAEEAFGAAANGVAFGRHVCSDGDVDFVAQSTTNTLGAANAEPRVGPIVINEILYHPVVGADEFVELYNASDAPVGLYDGANPANTWRLTNAVDYAFPAGVTMDPGEYVLVVATNAADFRARYGIGASVQVFGPYSGMLDNGGESVELVRPDAPDPEGIPWIRVDRVKYNDDSPWAESPDGDGPSLERIDPAGYGNDSANWSASLAAGGTPGAPNSGVLVAATAGWRYYDRGVDLGTAWRAAPGGYDDSRWADGNAPLGYAADDGYPELDTTVSYGDDPANKHITTYFRKTFMLGAEPGLVTNLTLLAKYDDGFVAYLNGQEAARGSMPGGTIGYGTLAASHTAASYESFPLTAYAGALVRGLNVLAVEVHQSGGNSSDLFLDVQLTYAVEPGGNPPAAPSGLVATAASASRIDLRWTDASDNETGFKIDRRRTGTSTWERIGTTAADQTTYSDMSLPSGTTFYYMVKAYNADGNSAYSGVAAATTDAGPPAAPQSLTATAASTTRIELTWIDSSGNEQGFRIERSPNGSSGWVEIAAVAADVTSLTDNGLPPATPFYYRARAYNAAGTSPYSNIAGATTPAVTVRFSVSASNGSEGASPATLAVLLSGASIYEVRVDYAATGGTATAGGVDYTLSPGTLTFSPGQTSRSFSLTVTQDEEAESPDETVVLSLSNPANAQLGSPATHTYTIRDDDVLFTAYNDLAWFAGQLNTRITTYTRGQGGALVDYASGSALPVTVTVSDGGAGPWDFQGEPATAGDAYALFNGIVDCHGLLSYAPTNLVLSLHGLDPGRRYEFVLFGNRAEPAYTDRFTRTTIGGAASFQNLSPGAAPGDSQSVICTGSNPAGAVARFAAIDPGADGTVSFTVSDNDSKFYANAFMLKESDAGGTEEPVLEFTAYNDLMWQAGQLAANITTYAPWSVLGLATNGPLVNHADGTVLPVQVAVGTAEPFLTGYTNQGANAAAGTDAGAAFAGKVDAMGLAKGGYDLEFSGLDPARRYTLVLFGNRDNAAYTDRFAEFVISGATTFENQSSAGTQKATVSVADDLTRYCAGWNTTAGYVARYADIDPGADGRMRMTVQGVDAYLNAFMLQAYGAAGEEETTNSVPSGATWRYARGTAEASGPATAWRAAAFDDSGWAAGPAPFGYGSASFGTTLSDMQNSYGCLFLRRTFDVPEPGLISEVRLQGTYDDGFIVWINGREAERLNVAGAPGTFVPFDAFAANVVTDALPWSASLTGANLPNLVPGPNIMAVQVFNQTLGSSDLCFDVELALVRELLTPDEDADRDSMPDDWEIARLGGTGVAHNADSDGDGASNLEEYIAGTDPASTASTFAVSISASAGEMRVAFPTVVAAGTGYDGLTRHYALQQCSAAINDGVWDSVPGWSDVPAAGSALIYTNTSPAADTWYRARTWLE